MARMSRMKCLGAMLLVAFVISGCQTANNKWTAWKERRKPKPEFEGVEGPPKVTYWPYTIDKSNPKMTPMPRQIKDKLARKTEQSKRNTELAELTKEGNELLRNGQLEDARLVYSKALLIAPDDSDLHHRLAIVSDKQYRYPEADEHYQEALRLRPRDPNLLSDLGYSYMLRGSPQQAEQTLKEALAVAPTHKGAIKNLASIYAQQNRFPEAMEIFQKGLNQSETQLYVATFFPQRNVEMAAGTMPDQGYGANDRAMASGMNDSPGDLKKMNPQQVIAEMARRKRAGEMRRRLADERANAQARNFADDDLLAQQPARGMPLGQQPENRSGYNRSAIDPNQNQGDFWADGQSQGISGNPPSNGARPDNLQNRTASASQGISGGTEIFRGTSSQQRQARQMDPQIQQAWDNQSNGPANPIQQTNAGNNASQMATQLGMSAGPGSMFPVVPGSPGTRSMDVSSMSGPPNVGSVNAGPPAFDSRFSGEFQQTQGFQPQQNSLRTPGQSGAGNANDLGHNDGFSSIGPSSPIKDWGSPTSGPLNWQNGIGNSPSWANDNSSAGAAGTGLDSASEQKRPGQGSQRSDSFDGFQSGLNSTGVNSTSRSARTGDGSPEYYGPWPSSNQSSGRQNQSLPQIRPNGSAKNPLDAVSGSLIPSDPNSVPPGSSGGSMQPYPYAPNR